MIEQQTIKNKQVWIKVQPFRVHRDNPNIIPTEYFIASYFLEQPVPGEANGQPIQDDNGNLKLFESPVAALGYAENYWRKYYELFHPYLYVFIILAVNLFCQILMLTFVI